MPTETHTDSGAYPHGNQDPTGMSVAPGDEAPPPGVGQTSGDVMEGNSEGSGFGFAVMADPPAGGEETEPGFGLVFNGDEGPAPDISSAPAAQAGPDAGEPAQAATDETGGSGLAIFEGGNSPDAWPGDAEGFGLVVLE